jgi:hypothetical protein
MTQSTTFANRRVSMAVRLGQVRAVAADLPLFLTAPLYRSRHLRWGATAGEVRAAMPGDELLPRAQFRCTRAVTIDSPPAAVWPWLLQAGCLRAGFYSDDLLDNLGHPSATTILPEWQHLEIGQWAVPMAPGAPTAETAFKVGGFEADKWLLWAKGDGTWSWTLTAVGDGATRLVTRVHAVYDWGKPVSAVGGMVLMEFGDFAMMRRMLLGIKRRAQTLNARRETVDSARRQ